MPLNSAEKSLKRIFKKITDEGIEDNYEYQSILENHHPSVRFINDRVMGFASNILDVCQAFESEDKKMELIRKPIWKGYPYIKTFGKVKGEKILDSYIAGKLFGIKLQYFHDYWIGWDGGWRGWGGANNIFSIDEDVVENWWNVQWEHEISENSYWGGEEIKDFLWKEIGDDAKTMIPKITSQMSQELRDEIGKRIERLEAMIKINDPCEDLFVCDDIWRELDLQKIHDDYEKEFIDT